MNSTWLLVGQGARIRIPARWIWQSHKYPPGQIFGRTIPREVQMQNSAPEANDPPGARRVFASRPAAGAADRKGMAERRFKEEVWRGGEKGRALGY
jgi:hypothetical protein